MNQLENGRKQKRFIRLIIHAQGYDIHPKKLPTLRQVKKESHDSAKGKMRQGYECEACPETVHQDSPSSRGLA